MKRAIVVDEDALAKERRKAMFAYAASLIANVVSFALGWLMAANWPQIAGRLGI